MDGLVMTDFEFAYCETARGPLTRLRSEATARQAPALSHPVGEGMAYYRGGVGLNIWVVLSRERREVHSLSDGHQRKILRVVGAAQGCRIFLALFTVIYR
jgi:hypothetical protein